jgi:ATP-dependent RNA helicase DDX49/DBP8
MSFKGTKRHLTADDLLRLQEQPSRKKVKTLSAPSTSRLGSSGQRDSDSESDQGDFSEGVHDYQPPIHMHLQENGENEDSEDDDEGRTRREHVQEDLHSSSDEDEETRAYAAPAIDRFASAFKKCNKGPELSLSKSASSFRDLGISSVLQGALASMSIKLPTEVQSACIPPILAGR